MEPFHSTKGSIVENFYFGFEYTVHIFFDFDLWLPKFWKSLCSPSLHLFAQKYSKNSYIKNIIAISRNCLKQLCCLIFFVETDIFSGLFDNK